MAIIISQFQTNIPQIRPLNVLRDLPCVADLVEKCFADTIDSEGRRYLQQMRRAGEDNAFMRWASNAVESVSMPLSGYIWEENGEIVGNVSLIPYRHKKKKIYLIANVAVRPDFRRKGIGHALTVTAMQHADQRRASAIWLHVRADNPGAIALYHNLGFQEIVRRTTWQAKPEQNPSSKGSEVGISRRSAQDWPQQATWLEHLYPELMAWYQPLPWYSLRPGLGPMFYRFIVEHDFYHWVVRKDGRLSGILSWQAMNDKSDRLWAAIPPQGGESALTTLLLHARRSLPWRQNLVIDYPAGEYISSFEAAGFHPQRTLLWMKLQTEDPVDNS